MTKILLALLLLSGSVGYALGAPAEQINVKILTADRLSVGDQNFGRNGETLHVFKYYNSREVSRNYPNCFEVHCRYKDSKPPPALSILRGQFIGVQVDCNQHLDYAEGLLSDVRVTGWRGSIGTAIGATSAVGFGDIAEAIGHRIIVNSGEEQTGLVIQVANGIGIRSNSDIEIRGKRGYTGWVEAGQRLYFEGGILVE